jgi:predicted membrane protein
MPILALFVLIFVVYLMVEFKAVRNLWVALSIGMFFFAILRITPYGLPLIALGIIIGVPLYKKYHHYFKGSYARNKPAKIAAMSRKEALEILGLEEGVNTADIKAAYHKLMATNHPDHGGSAFIASQINQAKSVLLSSSK